MPAFPEPSTANLYLVEHINLLRQSLRHHKKDLLNANQLTDLSDVEIAKAIYYAPFVVVSHDTSPDPIFSYGNKTALNLFEMTWAEFTSLPSRQSAEPLNRAERDRLLTTVSTQGFIDDYAGIRISKSGKRFWIEQATVWNLIDAENNYRGQAAYFDTWRDV